MDAIEEGRPGGRVEAGPFFQMADFAGKGGTAGDLRTVHCAISAASKPGAREASCSAVEEHRRQVTFTNFHPAARAASLAAIFERRSSNPHDPRRQAALERLRPNHCRRTRSAQCVGAGQVRRHGPRASWCALETGRRHR